MSSPQINSTCPACGASATPHDELHFKCKNSESCGYVFIPGDLAGQEKLSRHQQLLNKEYSWLRDACLFRGM